MKNYQIALILIMFLAVNLTAGTGFREKTVNWLQSHQMSREMIVVFISMLPIIELRGAIPVGIFAFNFSWQKSASLSIIGNMIPIPFVLLFMDGAVLLLRRSKRGNRFVEWLFHRTRSKSKVIEKYESVGLAIFVGIPLPGTGAWTGAFAANIFGLRFWRSLFFIFIGVLLAATAVTTLCQMGVIAIQ